MKSKDINYIRKIVTVIKTFVRLYKNKSEIKQFIFKQYTNCLLLSFDFLLFIAFFNVEIL